jgi:hypothetical protein
MQETKIKNFSTFSQKSIDKIEKMWFFIIRK